MTTETAIYAGPYVGVSVEVTFRVTIEPNGLALWSADGRVMPDDTTYVGNGRTPAEAADSLSRTLAVHARHIPEAIG